MAVEFEPSWSDYALGWGDKNTGISHSGFLSPAISLGGTVLGGYLGLQGLKQSKKEFEFQKDAWNKQYAQAVDDKNYQRNQRTRNAQNTLGMTAEQRDMLNNYYNTGDSFKSQYTPEGYDYNTQKSQYDSYLNAQNNIPRDQISGVPINTNSTNQSLGGSAFVNTNNALTSPYGTAPVASASATPVVPTVEQAPKREIVKRRTNPTLATQNEVATV